MLAAARCAVEKRSTTHRGHAEEMAAGLDAEAWDVVACCSGDGLPHEVFNGLARQARPALALRTVAVANLPCGSGNAMAWNLCGTDEPGAAALAMIKGRRAALDLVSVTQASGERRLSFLTQSVGIIAECDLGTESLRWMGDTRFLLGYLTRTVTKKVWPCDVAVGVEVEGKDEIVNRYYARLDGPTGDKAEGARTTDEGDDDQLPPLRFGTVNDELPANWKMTPYLNMGNFYAGNMAIVSKDTNFFPAALPNDGFIDLLTVDGDISRRRAIALTDTVTDGSVIDQKEVRYLKVSGYRIVPRQKEGFISIDGERIPFGGFQAEVHKGLGCVLSKSVNHYEAKGPNKRQ
jgi:sphingosine kinase